MGRCMGHYGGPLAMRAWLGRINFMSGNYHEDDYWAGDDYVGPSKYGREVKTCRRCDREVEMSSDHGTCDSCASEMERGWEY